ncbi:YcdB/YcdC domain-containing protein [Clostridium butyricum]|uniref:YcdB/YcdC domain-containing protein n=1 Tax=Clostridium butyricum TaxID=1492 RepID=UPI003A121D36
MKSKRIIINSSIILIFLVIVVGVAFYKLFGESSKEINASKQFMSKLYSMNAVDTTEKLTNLKYERLKVINSQNELVNKTIVTQSYGIDLDKENNVVGFAKKDMKMSSSKLSESEAKTIAERYLMEICGNDLIYEDTKNEDDLPYYSFVYKKKENGYRLYFDEIKINIDRDSGYIDGYSNTTMLKKCMEPKINISQEEAETIANNYFIENNIPYELLETTELVYAGNTKTEKSKNNQLEVCYVVSVKAKNSDESQVLIKIFVNADSGEIYNVIKENGESKVLTVN